MESSGGSARRLTAAPPFPFVEMEAVRIEALDCNLFDGGKEPVDFGVKVVFFGGLFGFARSLDSGFGVGCRFEFGPASAEGFGSDLSADSL
jgi:hypothetical protein